MTRSATLRKRKAERGSSTSSKHQRFTSNKCETSLKATKNNHKQHATGTTILNPVRKTPKASIKVKTRSDDFSEHVISISVKSKIISGQQLHEKHLIEMSNDEHAILSCRPIFDVSGFVEISGTSSMNWSEISSWIAKKKPQHVVINDCSITVDNTLKHALLGCETSVRTLDLSHSGLEKSSLSEILPLAFVSNITTLILVDCGLSSKDLNSVAQQTKMLAIECLDLSCNYLNHDAMGHLASIISSTSRMTKLGLSDCRLNSRSLGIFARHTTVKIGEVDLSDNSIGDDQSLRMVQKLTERLRPNKLLLNNCDIENIRVLLDPITSKVEIPHLEIGENVGIRGRDVGELASLRKIKDLCAFNCSFTADDIKDLRVGLGVHKLELLDVSESMEIPSERKRSEVCLLEELFKVEFKNATSK